jgi:hypothetical protein
VRQVVRVGVIIAASICLASLLSSVTPAIAQKSTSQSWDSQPLKSIMQGQSSRDECDQPRVGGSDDGEVCSIFDSHGAYNIRSILRSERSNDETATTARPNTQYMTQSNRCIQVNVGTGNSGTCSNLGVQSATSTAGSGSNTQYMTQSNRCIQLNVGTGNSGTCSNLGVQGATSTGSSGSNIQYMSQSNRCIQVNVGTGNSASCSNNGAQFSGG